MGTALSTLPGANLGSQAGSRAVGRDPWAHAQDPKSSVGKMWVGRGVRLLGFESWLFSL